MKFIAVKHKDGSVSGYSCGTRHTWSEETKEWKHIERTEEEETQQCYENLIDDIKRKEFEKNLISIIGNYYELGEKWKNIKIEITGNGTCEMNISNKDNMEWTKIDIPLEIEDK